MWNLHEDPSDRADYTLPEITFTPLQYTPFHESIHHANKNDYINNLTWQVDNNFAHAQYVLRNKELAIIKNKPVISYEHRPWNTKKKSFFSMFSNWPSLKQSDMIYCPELRKYVNRNYLTTLELKKDTINEIEIKEWQQQLQLRLPFWKINKFNIWPVRKMISSWSLQVDNDNDGIISSYEHNQSTMKSNEQYSNLKKTEDSNKTIYPKVTLKAWNSLTSDPATWPYKLPSAKPWPKDKNGKSYNPNADLIYKLGLSKIMNWSNNKDIKSERFTFQKTINRVSFKDMLNKEDLTRLHDSTYKAISNKSNYMDYEKLKHKRSINKKSTWTYQNVKQFEGQVKPQIAFNSLKNRKRDTWKNNHEASASYWSKENSQFLPLLKMWFTHGYKYKPDVNDKNLSFFQYRPLTIKSNEQIWLNKNNLRGSWKNDATYGDFWNVEINDRNPWKKKFNESSLSKTKKLFHPISMKNMLPSLQLRKNNNLKTNNYSALMKFNNILNSTNIDIQSSIPNHLPSWLMKEKFEDLWHKANGILSQKLKSSNIKTNNFSNILSSKNYDKIWQKQSNHNFWKHKINNDSDVGYETISTNSWPSKWKQFAYHKVTAIPISKSETTVNVPLSKSKNAFVAVSAVFSANYINNRKRQNTEKKKYEINKLKEAQKSNYLLTMDTSQMNNNFRKKNNNIDSLENQ